MKCQNCGKNEANFRYTEIVNGVKKEIILCEECKKELGIQGLDFNIPINFSSFFGDFLNEYDNSSLFPMLAKQKQLKCNSCGMSYDEFIKEGKFGCSNCYNVFDSKVEPILKRIHGESKYLGRKGKISKASIHKEDSNMNKEIQENTNSKTEKEQTLIELKKELKKLIKEEKYEEAAILRDKIKLLEK